MKITDLEPQKKRKDRVNLYVDNEFIAGLEITTAARLGFFIGKEVTSTDLNMLEGEEEYQKCLDKAFGLISRRLQSERELWQKLGKSCEKPTIGRVLDRLRELGYANDEQFTEMWVRERKQSRGKKLLNQELIQKGISKDTIAKYLSEINPDDENEVALRLARRKYKKELDSEDNYQRVSGLLARKGYNYSTIKTVLDILKSE